MHKIVTIVFIVMLTVVGANAFAYQFWGVNVGTAAYDSSTQLTFDGLSGSGIQYAVGGWKYTRVDGQWFGAFAAPIPGEGWLASRRSDAQGIFFKSDGANACFTVVTTASQNGQLATELGYDRRLFGGGDLKIDVGGHTYGVGMRNSNLLWAENPSATQPQYQIYGADGNIISMNSRDAGTLGSVVQDPDWARAGNQSLPADSDYRFAFFVNGTGSVVGWAASQLCRYRHFHERRTCLFLRSNSSLDDFGDHRRAIVQRFVETRLRKRSDLVGFQQERLEFPRPRAGHYRLACRRDYWTGAQEAPLTSEETQSIYCIGEDGRVPNKMAGHRCPAILPHLSVENRLHILSALERSRIAFDATLAELASEVIDAPISLRVHPIADLAIHISDVVQTVRV